MSLANELGKVQKRGEFYKPKTPEEIEQEAIENISSFEEQIKVFKEASEELTFRLAVMSDGIKRLLKNSQHSKDGITKS